MDSPYNNNVTSFELINVRGPKTPLRQLLVLVATYKGHKPKIIEESIIELEERQPHGTLRIGGFWPSVEYLNDRYPYPPIYPGSVVQDAITRSVVTSMEKDANPVLSMLKHGKRDGHFLTGPTPTLIDLAATSFADLTDPFWLDHFNKLAGFIKERKVA
jgi:hypothetical protein